MRKEASISSPDVRFNCIRCGNCCRNTDRVERRILLTKKDSEIISSATKLRIEDLLIKVLRKNILIP
ncbi:MAG: hypothetical protein QXZ04_01525 [Thermoproteota archaeon]